MLGMADEPRPATTAAPKSSATVKLAGLPHEPETALAAARGSPVFLGPRGRVYDECSPCFCQAAFSFTSKAKGIAIGSIWDGCGAVVLQEARFVQALVHEARISIAYSVQAVAQVKAISSST